MGSPATEPARDRALDGLRGLAAMVVVIGHVALISPPIADTIRGQAASVGSWAWLVANTPVGVLFDGGAAVTIFFVLSGYVLMLPLLNARTSRSTGGPLGQWAAYYPRRLVRLYLPLWGALILAALWQQAVPQKHDYASWWLIDQTTHSSFAGIIKDAFVLGGVNTLDGPLWSLRWEIFFSLLLPLYFLAATRFRQAWAVKVVLCAIAVAVGAKTSHDALRYLPVFLLGCILAVEQERLRAALARVTARGMAVLVVVGVFLLLADQFAVQGSTPSLAVLSVLTGVASVGAGVIVALTLVASPLRRLCETRAVLWLGAVSFSLYLTHEPLVVRFAYLFGGTPNVVLLGLLTIPLSLLLAWAFHAVIEAPSTEFSRRVGRAVTARSTAGLFRTPKPGVAAAQADRAGARP